VSRFGSSIGVLDGGGCAASGMGSFGVQSPVLGFQITIDFNVTQATGRGKHFAMTSCRLTGW